MKFALIIGVTLIVFAFLGAGIWGWAPDRLRSELEAKYLRSRADYREIAGVALHVRDSGPEDAPAVILMHGFGSSLHTWEPWAERLSADHRVIRFDFPGSGLSGVDPTGDYRDPRSLEIVGALMDRLQLRRASLIGNSMGGRIAWKFAALHPERVDKLVLISPDGFASPGFEYGKPPQVPPTMHLMQYLLPKAMVRMSLEPGYANPARLSEDAVTRYYELMLAPGARAAMIARLQQYMPEDPRPLLALIQAPTLLVWGEKDAMIPFSNAADYVKVIPHCALAAFPGLGHLPQEESPLESLEPVERFLAP